MADVEIREAHDRVAQIVVKGTEYHEAVTVMTVDKKEHSVEVYALSEKDLVEAFQAAGQDLKDIGNQDRMISNMKLMSELAARATRQPDIGKILLPLQSAPIALKALEISGLMGGEKRADAAPEGVPLGNLQQTESEKVTKEW